MIKAEIHENLIEILNKILVAQDTEVEIEIPDGSVLFENYLNLKILQAQAEESLKKVTFITSDEYGQKLIHNLSEERGTHPIDTTYNSSANLAETPYPTVPTKKRRISKPALPKVHLPKIRGRKTLLLIPILTVLLISLIGYIASSKQKAEVTLQLTSQTLTKSVEVQIKESVTSDMVTRVLEGKKYSIDTSVQSVLPTTGELTKGDKAEGEATIYNKTTVDKKFKKGTTLFYEKDDKTLEFLTDDDVTVPARTEPTPDDIKAGSAKVDITAKIVGKDYNLKKDTKLKVDDYKTSDYEAMITTETKGGDAWQVKIVTDTDLTTLETNLKNKAQTSNTAELNQKVPLGWKMIDKFVATTQGTPAFSHKLGEETTEITGTLTGKITGTAYSMSDLSKLIEETAKGLVPQGYIFNTMDKNYTADWLKEDATQVTFKFYVTPKLDEEKIKTEIKGKSLTKAQETLDKLNGVEQVTISVKPHLFGKLPTRVNNIELIQEAAGK